MRFNNSSTVLRVVQSMAEERHHSRREEAKFLEEAFKFLNAAPSEFEKGVKQGRDETIRDAAEKAWNATIQATTDLLLAKGFKGEDVKTYRQKRLKLEELSTKDYQVRHLGLRDRFIAREYTLQIRCFYDGEYTIDTIREELEKAKQYIEDVTKLLRL